MRGSWRTRVGAVAGAVAVALGALLGGSVLRPGPVSAAYCDDFPFLCTTYVVAPGGNGAGTVTTNDGFINCRSVAGTTSGTCSHRYVEDQDGFIHIDLNLTADAGDMACYKTNCAADAQTQSFSVNSTTGTYTDSYPAFRHEDCVAYPTMCKNLTINMSGDGSGNVMAGVDGLDCDYTGGAGQCTWRFFTGNTGTPPQIYVLGTAATGSEVCEDSVCGPTADFNTRLYSDQTFSFTFNLLTYDVTVARAGNGSGRVISSPGGIDCGSDCTGSWKHGDSVTLSAAANAGSTFASWSGACAGQDATCDLVVTGTSTSTATFVKAGASATPGSTLSPAATPRPTPSPGATATPVGTLRPATHGPTPSSDATAAPGESPGVSVPGGSIDLPTPGPSAAATPVDSGTVGSPGAPGSTDRPLPVAGGATGNDIGLFALAIVVAGILIAIGLAVGLRGRRANAAGSADEGA
jgi:hypothetical protein